MKIKAPLLALFGVLALGASPMAMAAPQDAPMHLTAKSDKQKEKERIIRAKKKNQDRRENVRERREDVQERREDARERVEDRQERREDAYDRRDDRRDAIRDRRRELADYRANIRDRQRDRFVSYYRNAYERRSCPPGLIRDNGGCYPRGWDHRRNWREGYALPSSVVYYDLPDSIYGFVDRAPYGYRYVQVGNDILLIDIATRIIVDAFAVY